jgi:hypothetical protein
MKYETMSNETKTFDWSGLPPGEYKFEGGELMQIDSAVADCDRAADDFVAALRRLTT